MKTRKSGKTVKAPGHREIFYVWRRKPPERAERALPSGLRATVAGYLLFIYFYYSRSLAR